MCHFGLDGRGRLFQRVVVTTETDKFRIARFCIITCVGFSFYCGSIETEHMLLTAFDVMFAFKMSFYVVVWLLGK